MSPAAAPTPKVTQAFGASRLCALAVLLLLAAPTGAGTPAYIALIIDDLGNHEASGERVIALPGPVTCSILPHTPYSRVLAERCKRAGKEVMLHLPMQPDSNDRQPGPGRLEQGLGRVQVNERVREGLATVPFAIGVNNHMGSHLTRHLVYMHWVMASLRDAGNFYFVDSFTSPSSVALRVARANGLQSVGRDVFLDHTPTRAHVREQLGELKAIARRNGLALAIGHPHAATLSELEQALPLLAAEGIILVTVSDLIRYADPDEQLWQASSYPWPTASKKSRLLR